VTWGAPARGNPPDADALVVLGREAERDGHVREALDYYERALHALGRTASPSLVSSVLRWIARAHNTLGDPEAALDCLRVAEAVAEAARDESALASALNTRASILFNLGELDDAESIFRRVRKLALRLGDRMIEAMADQNLGSVLSIRGDARQALAHFRVSLDSYESLGLTGYQGPLLNNIGRLLTDLGEATEAERAFDQALALCKTVGDRHHQILVEVNRARLLLNAGRASDALADCEAALETSRLLGDDRWLALIHTIAGSAQASLGDSASALERLGQAAEIARARKEVKMVADAVLEQASVHRTLGQNRETLLRLNEAHGIFRRLRATRELADAETRLSNLEATFLEIVRGWGESIDHRDAYTHGHCVRVAAYACHLALECGIAEEEITWFRMGALLHDVGKIRVPLTILNKRGPLDADEKLVMDQHPVVGIELLEGVEFPWDVRPMIRHHHERWDGRGYPDKIGGEEIPLSARILTIADVYDALTTTRSYRAAFSKKEALRIMASENGVVVDPKLFPIFQEQMLKTEFVTPSTELTPRALMA
jgi:putative nucleotidyltransferase with HDIG domain